jgi:hypothetical protein
MRNGFLGEDYTINFFLLKMIVEKTDQNHPLPFTYQLCVPQGSHLAEREKFLSTSFLTKGKGV